MKKVFSLILAVTVLLALVPVIGMGAAAATADNTLVFSESFDSDLGDFSQNVKSVTWADGVMVLDNTVNAGTTSNTTAKSVLIDVEPGTVYTLSLKAKFDNGANLLANVYEYTADDSSTHTTRLQNIPLLQPTAATSEYEKASLVFKTNTTTDKIMLTFLNQKKTVSGVANVTTMAYVDDVQVALHEHFDGASNDEVCEIKYYDLTGTSGNVAPGTALTSCAATIAAPSVDNGTFPIAPYGNSMGELDGWTASTLTAEFSAEDAEGRSNSGSAKLTVANDGVKAYYAIANKRSAVEGEKVYQLSWKYRTDSADLVLKPYLFVYNSDATANENFLGVEADVPVNDGWAAGSIVFKLNDAAIERLRIGFEASVSADAEAAAVVYLDDVVLTEYTHDHTDTDGDFLCDEVYRSEVTLDAHPYDVKCGESVICFKGAAVELNENINLQFFVKDPVGVSIDAKVSGTNAAGNGYTVEAGVSATADGWMIDVPLKAKQMADDITAKISVNGVEVDSHTYSIREYAAAVIAGNDYKDEAKTLVKAMLNYGAWAQQELGYNITDLANNELGTEALTAENADLSVLNEEQFAATTMNTANVGDVTCTVDGNSFNLVNNTSANAAGRLQATIAWEAGKTYVFSYDLVTGEDPIYRFYPQVQIGGVAYNPTKTDVISKALADAGMRIADTAVTTTTHYSVEFTVPADATLSGTTNLIQFFFTLAAGDDVTVSNISVAEKKYAATVSGDSTAVGFVGYTLLMKDVTSLRLYFKDAATAVSLDGTAVSGDLPQGAHGYYAAFDGVKAAALSNAHTVSVNSDTLTISNLSVLSAARLAAKSSADEEMKHLGLALILYAEATDAYAATLA